MNVESAHRSAAVARVVALSMMADENLHPSELAALDAIDPWSKLGMSRDEFIGLTSECFDDLMCDMHASNRATLLDVPDLDASIAAVEDPQMQALAYRMVTALLPADGHLSGPELAVLQRMLDRWQLPPDVLKRALS
jgi:hypothetical protein